MCYLDLCAYDYLTIYKPISVMEFTAVLAWIGWNTVYRSESERAGRTKVLKRRCISFFSFLTETVNLSEKRSTMQR